MNVILKLVLSLGWVGSAPEQVCTLWGVVAQWSVLSVRRVPDSSTTLAAK